MSGLIHMTKQLGKKYLREERPEVINQNDTWHAGKSIEKTDE